jgi:hypothetical protein
MILNTFVIRWQVAGAKLLIIDKDAFAARSAAPSWVRYQLTLTRVFDHVDAC